MQESNSENRTISVIVERLAEKERSPARDEMSESEESSGSLEEE